MWAEAQGKRQVRAGCVGCLLAVSEFFGRTVYIVFLSIATSTNRQGLILRAALTAQQSHSDQTPRIHRQKLSTLREKEGKVDACPKAA